MITKSHLESPFYQKAVEEYNSTHPGQKPFEPNEKEIQYAQSLLDQGFHCMSRRSRTLCRFPIGKTGIKALEQIDPEEVKHIRKRIIDSTNDVAKQEYLQRVFVGLESEDKVKLTISEMAAWRKVNREEFNNIDLEHISSGNTEQQPFDELNVKSRTALIAEVKRLRKQIEELSK
jgi:hypothetical protein